MNGTAHGTVKPCKMSFPGQYRPPSYQLLCSPTYVHLCKRLIQCEIKKLLAAIICGFQTKDRSTSVEVTVTATSVQEKHGRAQVRASIYKRVSK